MAPAPVCAQAQFHRGQALIRIPYRFAHQLFRVERGDGVGLGWYSIETISESHSEIMPDGVGFVVLYTIGLTETERDTQDGQSVIQRLMSLFGSS